MWAVVKHYYPIKQLRHWYNYRSKDFFGSLKYRFPLSQVHQLFYFFEFRNNRYKNLFKGKFDTFRQAVDNLPRHAPAGYDNEASANMYRGFVGKLRTCDYPVLYWLSSIGHSINGICDFGGHIGLLYYGLKNHLNTTSDFTWTVYDVPAVVNSGRRFASERDADDLNFSDNLANISANIFIASGSLQYVDDKLGDILANLKQSSIEYVILNMTPMLENSHLYTINSIGTAYCPYRIINKAKMLEEMKNNGWELVAHWDNPEKSCIIPSQAISETIRYYGFFWKKANQ